MSFPRKKHLNISLPTKQSSLWKIKLSLSQKLSPSLNSHWNSRKLKRSITIIQLYPKNYHPSKKIYTSHSHQMSKNYIILLGLLQMCSVPHISLPESKLKNNRNMWKLALEILNKNNISQSLQIQKFEQANGQIWGEMKEHHNIF